MIYSMVPFPMTLSDPKPMFQGHWVNIDDLDVLCTQLTRDLFAIAKFLFYQQAYLILPVYVRTFFFVSITLIFSGIFAARCYA